MAGQGGQATMAKVRDVIRTLEDDGWFPVATRGSHRQFKHASKRRAPPWRESRLTICRPER
jgi:hypothetical protein